MRPPVPFRVDFRVRETEVGREVHYLEMARQGGNDLLRGAVGQAAEDRVEGVPGGVLDLDEVGEAGAAQMGKDRAHALTRAPLGGEQADREAVVARQQAQQLAAGITARTEHADAGGVARAGGRVAHGKPTQIAKAGGQKRAGNAELSVWRTGSSGGPCACRTSCAPRRGCRG